jgi:hypothetical protein
VGVFGDGYVDRWESTESWVGEGVMVMGAGESGKAKLVQMRQNKKGKTCTCQGGGPGGGAGCGEGVVLAVVFIIVIIMRFICVPLTNSAYKQLQPSSLSNQGTLRKNVSLVQKSRRTSIERSFFAECPELSWWRNGSNEEFSTV